MVSSASVSHEKEIKISIRFPLKMIWINRTTNHLINE